MLARLAAALVVSSASAIAQSPQWGIASSLLLPANSGGLIEVGDLNLDGRNDIITAGATPSVLLGQPNGTFMLLPGNPVGSGVSVLSIGDIDGDGIPDLYTGDQVRKGLGNGTFGSMLMPLGMSGSQGATLGRANGDGRVDLISAYDSSSSFGNSTGVKICLSSGTSGFYLPLVYDVVSGSGSNLLVADVDGDGRQDVLLSVANGFAVLAQLPNGGFTSQTYGRGSIVGQMSVGEFSGDLLPDIVTGGGQIITGQGNGMFGSGATLAGSTSGGGGWTEAFDADGDGRTDIALASSSPSPCLLIARNSGGGAFDTTCRVLLPQAPYAFKIANVLGDPRPEVIVSMYTGANNIWAIYVLRNLTPDCNGNGIDDPVEFANGWATDCNGNGIPDTCEVDCDANGLPDACQISANPSLDLDMDGNLDTCEVAGTPYCFGDGTGAVCPCDPGQAGPLGGGCANSLGGGGRLRAVGNAQVSLDSVTMTTSGIGDVAPGLLFQGTAFQAGGLGSLFGDGLLCVSGTVTRLIFHAASGGVIRYGRAEPGDPALSASGSVPALGATIYYQVWYRDSTPFCTPDGYNLTNGVSVGWTP